MEHRLVLDVPEEVYGPLIKTAEKAGQTPEQFIMDCLSSAVSGQGDDPIEQFIGAFHGSVPNWADRHDSYLGRSLNEKTAG